MNESEIFLPGKLSDRKTQLAWLGFKLETRGREWGMHICPWALWSSGFGYMQTQPRAGLSCYPFVAGVMVVSINTLGMCQTVGKKVCAMSGSTCIRL